MGEFAAEEFEIGGGADDGALRVFELGSEADGDAALGAELEAGDLEDGDVGGDGRAGDPFEGLLQLRDGTVLVAAAEFALAFATGEDEMSLPRPGVDLKRGRAGVCRSG